MSKYIENKVFAEIKIGDTATIKHTLTKQDIELFAIMSGDVNPAHLDTEYAKNDMFHKIIAHGMWGGSFISALLGTQLPGPGTIYLSQTLKFLKPIIIGDTIQTKIIVKNKDDVKKIVSFDCVCTNQENHDVIRGEAVVIAPTEKVRLNRIKLPLIEFKKQKCPSYHRIICMAKGLDPIRTAIIYPIDKNSLKGVVASTKDNLIKPILIGPEAVIKSIAKEENIDINIYEIVNVTTVQEAIKLAVIMARKGDAEAIMKGNVHTNELMEIIVDAQNGLRTDRRISHVIMADIPAYYKPLFVTDSAINIRPNLAQKKDIIQNAIDLFLKLDMGTPKVAILSAIETINENIPSTLDATALCKMAERGQIAGGILDGPLAFDNAVSEEAAMAKNIHSQVAGKADILVVPDLESGNILLKQLTLFSGASVAGVAVGAKVPIILTSRSSGELARTASCALALLLIRGHKSKNGDIPCTKGVQL